MRERVWRADPGPPVVRVGLQAAEQGRRPAVGVGDQRLKGLPEGADGAAGEALPPSLFGGGGDFMVDVLGAGRAASAYGSVGGMTTDSAHRGVRIERIGPSRYTASNDHGGQITVGAGGGTDFTPVELLLAAIGGCTSIDVDILTSRRAEPDAFEVLVDAEKVRDERGNHLTDLLVTFRVSFPDGEAGEAARAILPDAVKKSHDRLCTVTRTVELGMPVATRIE